METSCVLSIQRLLCLGEIGVVTTAEDTSLAIKAFAAAHLKA